MGLQGHAWGELYRVPVERKIRQRRDRRRALPGGFQPDTLDSLTTRPYTMAHEDRLSTPGCDDG